jgi:DNA-directed RNA polymerase specialized sigma24 family protein
MRRRAVIILFLTFDTEEEKEKFCEIYRDHAEFMIRVARRILQNTLDAEYMVQDAFLYVADHLEKINQFDRQKNTVLSRYYYRTQSN